MSCARETRFWLLGLFVSNQKYRRDAKTANYHDGNSYFEEVRCIDEAGNLNVGGSGSAWRRWIGEGRDHFSTPRDDGPNDGGVHRNIIFQCLDDRPVGKRSRS